MKKDIRKSILILLILVTVIVFPLGMSACDSDAKYYKGIKSYEEDIGEGYKKITVVTDNHSFSFEYSSFYLKVGPENIRPEFTIPDILVSLRAPKAHVDLVVPANKNSVKTVTTSYIPANISVKVYDPTFDNTEEPQSATEILSWRLEGEAKWNNFKLIERSPLIVSGIEGDYAEWEVDWMNLFPNKSNEPPLEYRWQVLFDYKGLIWQIEALSLGPELRDQVKADFDHVIQTFKILVSLS